MIIYRSKHSLSKNSPRRKPSGYASIVRLFEPHGLRRGLFLELLKF